MKGTKNPTGRPTGRTKPAKTSKKTPELSEEAVNRVAGGRAPIAPNRPIPEDDDPRLP